MAATVHTHKQTVCKHSPERLANFLPPPTSKRGKQTTSCKQLQKLGSWANPQIKKHKHNNSHAESQPSSAYPKKKKQQQRTQPSTTNQRRQKEHYRHPLRYVKLTQAFGTSNPNFTKTDHTYPVSIIRQNLLNQRRHSKSHTRKMKKKPSRDNNLKTTATTTITTATRKLLFPGLPSIRRYYYHSTTPVPSSFSFPSFFVFTTRRRRRRQQQHQKMLGNAEILSHQRCMTLADLSADL